MTRPHTPPAKPSLLDRVRQRIRLRHNSIRTEEAYVQAVRRFILFHDQQRPAVGEEEGTATGGPMSVGPPYLFR